MRTGLGLFLLYIFAPGLWSLGHIAYEYLPSNIPIRLPAQQRVDTKNDFDPAALEQIKRTDPFKTAAPTPKKILQPCTQPTASTRGLILLSTSVLTDPSKSVAQVQSGGKVLSLKVGDEVAPSLKVYEIERLQIILKDDETLGCEVVKRSEPLR